MVILNTSILLVVLQFTSIIKMYCFLYSKHGKKFNAKILIIRINKINRLEQIAEIYSMSVVELLSYNCSKKTKPEMLYKQIIKKDEDIISSLKEQVHLYKTLYYDLKT